MAEVNNTDRRGEEQEPFAERPLWERYQLLFRWRDEILELPDRHDLERAAAHELRALQAEVEGRGVDCLLALVDAYTIVLRAQRAAQRRGAA